MTIYIPNRGVFVSTPSAAAGSASVASEFWAIPPAPTSDDHEFLGSTLPPDGLCWSPTTGLAVTRDVATPDIFQSPTPGQYRAAVGQKASYLTLQAGAKVAGGDQQYYYYFPINSLMADAGNYTWRLRSRGWITSTAGAGDFYGATQLAFYGESAGLPNLTYFLRFGLGCQAGAPATPRLESWGFDGGLNNLQVATNLNRLPFDGDGEYAITYRSGIGWGTWWIPASGGAWFALGPSGGFWTGVVPSAMRFVGIYFGGGQGSIPGRPLILSDYIRRENQCSVL